MPIRGEIQKNLSFQQFWTPKTAKLYEINLKHYFCTDIIGQSKKNSLKKHFEIVANFINLQSGLKRRQMWKFAEKYKTIKFAKFSKFAK